MSVPRSTPIQSEDGKGATGAINRATLARFVAEALAEPDQQWYARLSNAEALRELDSALKALEAPIDHQITGLFKRISMDSIRDERNAVLGHTVRSACPPYELEYHRNEVFQQSQQLADIAGFYAAFGYMAGGSLGERPDHAVAEWEFLSLLALKEALAVEVGDATAAQICRDAEAAFLRDHVAGWFPAFLSRLRKTDAAFYGGVAIIADWVLRVWCANLGVAMGPAWLELRPVEEEDTTISCGVAANGGEVEIGPALAAAMDARS